MVIISAGSVMYRKEQKKMIPVSFMCVVVVKVNILPATDVSESPESGRHTHSAPCPIPTETPKRKKAIKSNNKGTS